MVRPSDGTELADELDDNLNVEDGDTPTVLSDEQLQRLVPDLHEDSGQRECLHKLRDLQAEHDKAFSDYLREKQELEDRYEKKAAPLFTSRKAQLDSHPIKLFWFKAFEHCEVLRENITDKDAVALKFLTDVSCENVTQRKDVDANTPPSLPVGSFTLTFRFADNPFFENDVLTKTYIMHEDDCEELDEARGTKVLWKHQKDLTVRTLKKKTKNGRVLIKKQPTDSFFNFFSPPQHMVDDKDEVDESMLDELEDVMDADFELGDCIRSEVIPRALLYFLNIAELSDEDDEEDSTDEDSTDEDEDDEAADHGAPNGQRTEKAPGLDEDDESDDSDDAGAPKQSSLPPAAQTAEECKQQ